MLVLRKGRKEERNDDDDEEGGEVTRGVKMSLAEVDAMGVVERLLVPCFLLSFLLSCCVSLGKLFGIL